MELSCIEIEIKYPDLSTKCQRLTREAFLDDTAALVFAKDLMTEGDRRLFGRHANWRKNPCILRIFPDSRSPEAICQSGTRHKGFALKHRRSSGRLNNIIFTWTDDQKKLTRQYDATWLGLTAAIVFRTTSYLKVATNGVVYRVGVEGDTEAITHGQLLEHQPFPLMPRDGNACGFGPLVNNKGIG